jgi:hypothetical protein
MEIELETAPPSDILPQKQKRHWFLALIDAWFLYVIVTWALRHHSFWCIVASTLVGLIVLWGLLAAAFPTGTSRAAFSLFGQVQYVQDSSPALEQRVRNRYRTSLDEFQSLGFTPLFVNAQTFPLARLLLVFPALVILLMLIKREVLAVRAGRVLSARPVFASSGRIAYGSTGGLGIKFHTLLKDGTLLISANFGEDASAPNFTLRTQKGATLQETWASHQALVQSRATTDNPIDMKFSFDEYVEIVR